MRQYFSFVLQNVEQILSSLIIDCSGYWTLDYTASMLTATRGQCKTRHPNHVKYLGENQGFVCFIMDMWAYLALIIQYNNKQQQQKFFEIKRALVFIHVNSDLKTKTEYQLDLYN